MLLLLTMTTLSSLSVYGWVTTTRVPSPLPTSSLTTTLTPAHRYYYRGPPQQLQTDGGRRWRSTTRTTTMSPPPSFLSATAAGGFGGGGSGKKAKKTKGGGSGGSSGGSSTAKKLKPKQQWDRFTTALKGEDRFPVAVRRVVEDGDGGDSDETAASEWLEVGCVRSREGRYTEAAVALQRGLIAEVRTVGSVLADAIINDVRIRKKIGRRRDESINEGVKSPLSTGPIDCSMQLCVCSAARSLFVVAQLLLSLSLKHTRGRVYAASHFCSALPLLARQAAVSDENIGQGSAGVGVPLGRWWRRRRDELDRRRSQEVFGGGGGCRETDRVRGRG